MLTEEQIRVGMDDPEKLKRWLVESGRRFVIFESVDLVDALSWPDGVEEFKRVVDLYRDHRRTIPSERIEVQPDGNGDPVEVSCFKGEVLEPEEMLELYRQLREDLVEWGRLPPKTI